MKTIKGNLITLAEQGEFDVIVSGCNCFHAMGGGIAKQLAEKYPQVEEADKQTKFGDRKKLGSYSVATVEVNDTLFVILNAYTQYKWSSGSDVFEYDAFQKFLNKIYLYIQTYKAGGKLSIGFPIIGAGRAGLAGGDWGRISKMIEEFSERVKDFAEVTVVEYQP
jgi:O-acetyl-ADP-ribose deacetylase (regulator of RNase III)